ncbi:hypothetical protein HELRODRAFT_108992 [Helobdella robusta]|uniref:E3 ubiquitin-protein ligase CHIP n=1 Tax=Helobdella robusta TaxID=6412 RepID=T1EEP7_HELRO|nr:hypothetical protein HELRODRAFT_108992 [Helobdella robusta]ESO10562.1 hypothetical protein HELRODRAFT_108992 [Helobdella robusta]
MTSSQKSADDLRELGNNCFMARNYAEAINFYTKAIIRKPDLATLYTNRAICYIRLKQWDQACQDCEKSAEMNPSHFKAYYLKGQALLELNFIDEAIASLHKAMELSKEQRANVGDSISKVMRQARKRRFLLAEDVRRKQEIELQTELTSLLVEEKLKQLQLANIQHEMDGKNSVISDLTDSIEDAYANRIALLNNLFEEVDDRRKKRDVPDVFCSRINFCIMKDPVITPSGITYERADIEEHFKKLGNFDPVSRKELTTDQLIPNLALKEVIDNFIEENPWADDY